jgi:hypothetical protein
VLYEHFCDLYGDALAPEESSWHIAPERFELALTGELKGVFDELHAEYPDADNIDISQRIAELQNAGCTHAPAQFAREAYIDQTPGGIYGRYLPTTRRSTSCPAGKCTTRSTSFAPISAQSRSRSTPTNSALSASSARSPKD